MTATSIPEARRSYIIAKSIKGFRPTMTHQEKHDNLVKKGEGIAYVKLHSEQSNALKNGNPAPIPPGAQWFDWFVDKRIWIAFGKYYKGPSWQRMTSSALQLTPPSGPAETPFPDVFSNEEPDRHAGETITIPEAINAEWARQRELAFEQQMEIAAAAAPVVDVEGEKLTQDAKRKRLIQLDKDRATMKASVAFMLACREKAMQRRRMDIEKRADVLPLSELNNEVVKEKRV
jgi:hypothetical protein